MAPPDPADVLPPSDPAPRAPRSGAIVCEFCECRLAASGEVLKISTTAKGYRDGAESHTRAVADLEAKIAALSTQLAAANARIAELDPKPGTGAARRLTLI
jgi:hypothetical protein